MFSTEFLHRIREHELEFFRGYLPSGARVLEIGGGTGLQAKRLSEMGYDIVSIDLPGSDYSDQRVWPVQDYDGRTIPFPDASFDVVLSSNVMEHILDLDAMEAEIRRVLRRDGFCLHAMPSATWRLWTSLASYVEWAQRSAAAVVGALPRSARRGELRRPLRAVFELAKLAVVYAVPPRHGEVGNAFTELWTFSRRWWLRHFRRAGCEVLEVVPMGLFYTGHMVLGARWSLASRARWARRLGSACILYRVRPSPDATQVRR